jgi:hypothetical protein
MATEHRCWRFDMDTAARAFEGLSSLDDILGPNVTERAARARSDRAREDQLVMLRLDPSDAETWDLILEPKPADYGQERAAAARLMLLLSEACERAVGIRVGPGELAPFLAAAGWPAKRVHHTLHGESLTSFFAQHVAPLSDEARQCREWLQGGWIDAPVAAELRSGLSQDMPALLEALPAFAAQRGTATGRSLEWHAQRVRLALADFEAMLAHVAAGDAIWTVVD